jgi:hypothetical protein
MCAQQGHSTLGQALLNPQALGGFANELWRVAYEFRVRMLGRLHPTR